MLCLATSSRVKVDPNEEVKVDVMEETLSSSDAGALAGYEYLGISDDPDGLNHEEGNKAHLALEVSTHSNQLR